MTVSTQLMAPTATHYDHDDEENLSLVIIESVESEA
ncbi:hypothetical protein PC129_g1084 [Phytophthora cactorum]|uniref:Uncharacterized protein n=1 Tax=Phytophthora cactorum TaxID=29920 RepID=A0A8T1DGM9_9STRA|nr:hypothetical protein PC112_g4346 [Phytophthora cactorum]KAG2840779.1 hypothetical protein PC111_g3334 [Phytophthora cactorum]KAG2864816.1 hypothetical protein PC113_g4240 [Phytophthora cactorum]KAG2923819.1 hypothetical protein PC114_g4657 [Phytophthora cactorum]KAG2938202.1 hypothetical protein PC115_g3834 [Phytophthora cactorum]